MEIFEHLNMFIFMILGLAMVKLMTIVGSLFAKKNYSKRNKWGRRKSQIVISLLNKYNFI